MMRQLTRLGALWLATALMLIATAPVAMADAAGPTDYRTDIVSVEPATSAFQVEMIGGDAFLSLEQLEPVEIIVPGYESEPYLRFDPDGAVYENRRSPAVWLNEERYGNEEPPAFARADARPEWFVIADGGRYAWHDHRSHWMNPRPPPGAEAGDQVLEATVRVLVDGEPVTITVASYLLDSPSLLPAIGGVLCGVAATVFTWQRGRMPRALVGLLGSGAAGVLGAVAFGSVPVETEPTRLLWLLPLLAIAATLVLVLIRRHTATTVYLDGLAIVVGAALGGWGFLRFDAVRRALIPSDAPAAIDRFTITAALVIGAALIVQGLIGLARPQRLIPVEVSP